MSCTFCRIESGELPASRLLERALTVAFLDIHPVSSGHTLVVPRRHVESFTHLSSEEAAEFFTIAQLVGRILKSSIPDCEGVTLSLADGVSAGQEVPHAHLHIIPRRYGDEFGWKFPQHYSTEPASRDALEIVAARIRASIASMIGS